MTTFTKIIAAFNTNSSGPGLPLGLRPTIKYLAMKKLLTHNANMDKFVRFLKAHKAFSKFERNRNKCNKRSEYLETLREHIEACDRQLAVYIGSAFAWGLTSEGREYWNEINIIWEKTREYELQGFKY